MLDLVPDVARLNEMFAQAMAPTFFLGAIAGFISLMSARLSAVIERIQALNAIPEDDPARFHLKDDLERLRLRARLLNSGILSALYAGICATVLLAILFVTAFLRLKHAIGGPLLFILATCFLGFALVRFTQEARVSLAEADEYR